MTLLIRCYVQKLYWNCALTKGYFCLVEWIPVNSAVAANQVFLQINYRNFSNFLK